MELLDPLKDELSDNFELATSTQNLIREERDMLQGDAESRVVLFQFSTDVWESVIGSGTLESFDESADKIAEAYRQLQEINAIIDKFNRFGNRIMYTPLLRTSTDVYNRENLLDIIAQMCSEVTVVLREAQEELEDIIQTECPACGKRFPSRTAMKSHVTQKTDPEHDAIREKIR